MNDRISRKQHVGVYGIVRHEDKLLLVTKSRGPYTGQLDLPGGRFEHGEAPIDTLKRELYEEAGIVVENATLRAVWATTVLYVDDAQEVSLHHVGIIYQVDMFRGGNLQVTKDNEDVSGVGWYDLNNVGEQGMTPFVRAIWERTRG